MASCATSGSRWRARESCSLGTRRRSSALRREVDGPMRSRTLSRRSFLKGSATLAGGGAAWLSLLGAQDGAPEKPLIAYVGTYSSPLRNVRPTQVDLPPGNGRGIHLFRVDRTTGALSPAGVHEMGT